MLLWLFFPQVIKINNDFEFCKDGAFVGHEHERFVRYILNWPQMHIKHITANRVLYRD